MSTYSGGIKITPALNWKQIQDVTAALKAAAAKSGGSKSTKDRIANCPPEEMLAAMGFGLDIQSSTRETEDGTLQVKSADLLTFASDEPWMFMNEVEVVKVVLKTVPTVRLDGTLIYINDEGTSGTKTTVSGTRIHTVHGTTFMHWDGDTGQGTKLANLI